MTNGEVQGWRFQDPGKANPSDPPPTTPADFAAICSAASSPTTTTPTTTTRATSVGDFYDYHGSVDRPNAGYRPVGERPGDVQRTRAHLYVIEREGGLVTGRQGGSRPFDPDHRSAHQSPGVEAR